MIFFMVKKMYMSNKSECLSVSHACYVLHGVLALWNKHPSTQAEGAGATANTESASASTIVEAKAELSSADGTHSDLAIGNDNNGPGPDDNEPFKDKYTKVLIKDPYNNRDALKKLTKRQKGVYVWSTLNNRYKYVGHSITLYNRISSYFLPSIIKSNARKALGHLNKHEFKEMTLTVYIMDIESKVEDVVALEEHLSTYWTWEPNLNVSVVVSSCDNEPLDQAMRERMLASHTLKGTPVYVYEAETLCLLFIFDSKQYMYKAISIHHKTLDDCLDSGGLYLDYFFLSIEPIEAASLKLIALDDMKALVISKWDAYKCKYHPAARAVLAIFKDDESKNIQCDSLGSLARRLKGDRTVIRGYLKGERPGMYYRGKWQFTYV